MAQSVLLKAAGLYTFPNRLSSVPQGALLRALNIIINRDNIIESRRGLSIFGNAMGTDSTLTAHQLTTYKGRLIRHYGASAGDTLQFDSDGAGTFQTFTFILNGTLHATTTVDNITSTSQLSIGMKVSGTNIPTGTTIASITNNTTLVLSQAATGSGVTSLTFTPVISEVQTGLRIKGLEANSNFYFTTSDGIKKIATDTVANLSSASITNSGGFKGLDLKTTLNTTPGFLTQESVVAYRIVWGIKDINQNLILGSPSERSVIYNPLTGLLVTNFNSLLTNLDTSTNPGGINDGNYVATLGLSPSATAAQLRTALISLALKIDNDVVITEGAINTASASVTSNVASLVFNSSVTTFLQIGDQIVISGLTGVGTTADLNGTQTLTGVSGTTVTFNITHGNFGATVDVGGAVKRLKYTLITQPSTLSSTPTTIELESLQTYYSTIVSDLQTELSGITTAATYNTNNATTSATVNLTSTIPTGITTSYFYQVYRSALTTSSDASVLSDLDPGDELQLVFEDNPTSTDITNGYISIHDVTPDSFRGANLYTNPNTGDGILQANEVPPLAKDIASFKDYTFFANTQTKQRLDISLLSVSQLTANVSTITITDGVTTNTYTFATAEDIPNKKVLISSLPSVAQEVDETARSICRVINRNLGEIVYAYYLSGSNDVPGLMLFEARTLGQDKFYVSVNSDATASQFNPNLPTIHAITSNTLANPTVVTSASHGLTSGNQIFISGSNSTPSIDGLYSVLVTGANTFTVPVNVTIAGTSGGWILSSSSLSSDNEVSPNRIYYSKVSQPEAVPIVNYVDAGPKDKEILRILALRDNLFILKEEGIYRLSGLVAPFTVSLFDSSTNLAAPDSAAVLNNLIYGYTTQGVARVSDTGVEIISRPIEDLLLKLTIPAYTNFTTATFGLGYESDRSYYLWTVTDPSDVYATQCFRFNTFTNTWVESDKTARCGVVSPEVDKLYLGPTDTNYIEQERKSFNRTDYSDREIATTISVVSDDLVDITSVTNVSVGDVIVQTQYLTIKQINQLLTKLDNDVYLSDNNYYSSLVAVAGDILNTKLDSIISKIAADSGRVSIPGFTSAATYTALSPVSSSFSAVQTAFNSLITLLNTDIGVGSHNYLSSSGTVMQETIVTDVTDSTNQITTQFAYPFISGPAIVYNHIQCITQWVPQYMQDVSMSKQVSESTVIFEDSSYSSAIVSFASDLNPSFFPIAFNGNGNGTFGNNYYGQGVYGGNGSGIPFRTLIPREKQRCRYLNVKFEHDIAREIFSLYGISLTYMPISQKAYR